MSFNKEEYWKRRNNTVKVEVPDPKSNAKKPKMIEVEQPSPLRGQGDDLVVKVIPKGMPVYTYSNGENKDINKLGEHRSFGKNGKMIIANREESRRRRRLHFHTKKREGFAQFSAQHFYSKDEAKDLNLPSWRAKLPKNWVQPTPFHPVDMSNHDRHTLRAAQRALKAKFAREEKEKAEAA